MILARLNVALPWLSEPENSKLVNAVKTEAACFTIVEWTISGPGSASWYQCLSFCYISPTFVFYYAILVELWLKPLPT